MSQDKSLPNAQEGLKSIAEQIYHDWDEALANDDVEGLLKLYADDAVVESPLIPYLLNTGTGVRRGKKELLSTPIKKSLS